MTEGKNLSKDPTKVVLDTDHNYTGREMRAILNDRANVVYKPDSGATKKKRKRK